MVNHHPAQTLKSKWGTGYVWWETQKGNGTIPFPFPFFFTYQPLVYAYWKVDYCWFGPLSRSKKMIRAFLLCAVVLAIGGSGCGKGDCSSCGGTGKMTVTCAACGGVGQFTVTPPGKTYPCKTCGGSGHHSITCPSCRGSGNVDPLNQNKQ
jgi:hypothetical protein